jgi:hypothetical protein
MRGFAVALPAYAVLTLLLFHGLVGRFSTAVPHDLGDPLLSAWILWWNAQHLPFVGAWWDGLSFYPGHGSLAFSDHRVGLTLIAGPVQWLGGTPVLAYNVTLLSSFVLCALAAHSLTWLLTRSHAAGAVSGLIFGFNPFRISHIAHLELLAVFWLPLAFAALHLYVRRFDVRWLILFAVLWALQGLSSGYYLFYSAPVIGLWAIWFGRERPWRGIGAIMLACGVVFLVLLPVLLKYRAIQNQLLLTRSFAEIEAFSADITGILSATPIMALWRVPSLASNGEGEIYLGIFALLLVLAALVLAARGPRRGAAASASAKASADRRSLGEGWSDHPRLRATRLLVAVVGAVYALIAAGTLFGSWSFRIGPMTISASQTVQPLSVAVLCMIVLGLTSPAFLDAFRRRSVFAFYTTAAVLTWSFTLGPRPRLLGELLLYRGPYELLMLFPGFGDRLRVPARFVMMTILAVSVAAGIALIRLTASSPRAMRAAVTVLVLLAITADGWTFTCPMPSVPAFVAVPSHVPESAAVLEMPLGNVGHDIAAVYRSIAHGRHVVNGYSGYEPPHYRLLKTGLDERDDSVLTTLTRFAPLVMIIAREDDPGGGLAEFAERHPDAVRLEETAGRTLYLLPRTPVPGVAGGPGGDGGADRAADRSLPIRDATFNLGAFDLKAVTDGDPETVWATPKPQRGGEEVVIELQAAGSVSGVSLSTGPPLEGYPRSLAVATSIDGQRWEEAWTGGMAGPAVEGVLRDPRAVESRLDFSPKPARFIRLRQFGAHPDSGWFIAELKVYGSLSSR